MDQSENATVQIVIKHFINDNSGVKALSNHLGNEDTKMTNLIDTEHWRRNEISTCGKSAVKLFQKFNR